MACELSGAGNWSDLDFGETPDQDWSICLPERVRVCSILTTPSEAVSISANCTSLLSGTKQLTPSLPCHPTAARMRSLPRARSVALMEFNRMYRTSVADRLRVEVKHRCPAPNRYTWEIFCDDKILPVEESRDRLGSWEEASQAGKSALMKLLATHASASRRMMSVDY